MDMKKIKSPKTMFININPRPAWTKEKTMIDFPLGICYVVSETHRAGFDYDIFDLRVDPKTDEELVELAKSGQYDVVAMGYMSHGYYLIKNLCEKMKQALPNSKVIVGGTVATPMPEKFLNWTKADVAVIGEGEYTFVEILQRLKTTDDLSGILGIVYKGENGEILVEKDRLIKDEIENSLRKLRTGNLY